LFWHYIRVPAQPEVNSLAYFALRPLSMTWAGVDLFFVLSGFLIGGILLDQRSASNYFTVFYVRRACRILPLYAVLLGTFVAGIYLRPDNAWLFSDSVPLWSSATFTQNFIMAYNNSFDPQWLGITWSLAVEEQFYLLLPVIVWAIPERHLPKTFILCITFAIACRCLVWLGVPGREFFSYLMMPTRADSLMLGALLAWMARRKNLLNVIDANYRTCYVVLGLLLIGFAALTVASPAPHSSIMRTIGYSWLAALFGLALVLGLQPRGPINWISTRPWLRWLGTISYGVYLFHQGINGLVHGGEPSMQSIDDLMLTASSLVLTLTIASISYYFFEKPIVNFGQSLKYHGPVCERLVHHEMGTSRIRLPQSRPSRVQN
jgi:peptidoglycan/LPS O-acetylase OafA/YrhL